MARDFFLHTERLKFSVWTPDDLDLAKLLWGDPKVTRFICASGHFSASDITTRLATEIENNAVYGVQYWPVFGLSSGALMGCCGLRPHGENRFELGFHLRPDYWGQGYASEAAKAVIAHGFTVLKAESLFAGHHPQNVASQNVLKKLGFCHIGDTFYAPTGLYHPSYELRRETFQD